MNLERLREILLGDAPAPDERSSVRQALLETDAVAINCAPAQELANELGLTLAQLDHFEGLRAIAKRYVVYIPSKPFFWIALEF